MAQAPRKGAGKPATNKQSPSADNKTGKVTKKIDTVSYIVAPGRTVVHGVERLASGDEVNNMETHEIERLTGLGFLVKKTASVTSVEGPTLTPSDGPTVKAETDASNQGPETGASTTSASDVASGNAETQAFANTVES